MTLTLDFPEADAAVRALAQGSWSDGLPAAGPGGIDCGGGLRGLASEVMRHILPLEELMESAAGDPAGLYRGSHAWETYAGDAQTTSEILTRVLDQIRGQLQGLTAKVIEEVLAILAEAAHSLGNWSKVVSQVIQLCVRIVEIIRSLICAGFEMLASVSGSVTEFLFGSWPWEVDKKMQVIYDFAYNCEQVTTRVVSNVDRALQALREMVRLLTDLYRAVIPFHQQIENAIGALLQAFPPGQYLGPLGNLPGMVPPGHLGDTYNPDRIPYPGSEHKFDREYDLGYSHTFDLGPTDMTTEQLNLMLQQEFGHVFLPSREGENSQLNMQLTGEDQIIKTSLFGMGIPGVTSGDIVVQQVTSDGFVIAAMEGHPEHPGEVAFRLRNVDGRGVFEVTGAYDATILDTLGFGGNTNPAYAGISDVSIWADMQYRLEDMMNYGR